MVLVSPLPFVTTTGWKRQSLSSLVGGGGSDAPDSPSAASSAFPPSSASSTSLADAGDTLSERGSVGRRSADALNRPPYHPTPQQQPQPRASRRQPASKPQPAQQHQLSHHHPHPPTHHTQLQARHGPAAAGRPHHRRSCSFGDEPIPFGPSAAPAATCTTPSTMLLGRPSPSKSAHASQQSIIYAGTPAEGAGDGCDEDDDDDDDDDDERQAIAVAVNGLELVDDIHSTQTIERDAETSTTSLLSTPSSAQPSPTLTSKNEGSTPALELLSDTDLIVASLAVYSLKRWAALFPFALPTTLQPTATTGTAGAASNFLSSSTPTLGADGQRHVFRLVLEDMSARSLVIAAASTMEELLSDYEFIRTSMSRLAGTINLRRELVPVAPRLRSNSQSRFRSSSQEDVLAQTEPAIRMLLDDPRMSRLAIPDPADRRHHRKPEPVNNLFIHTVGASSPEERDGFDFDISIDSAADERRRAPSRGKRSRASSSSASATPPYSPVSMSIPIPIPTLADARPSAARHTTSDETIYACGSFGDSATTTTTTGQSSRASTGSNKSLGAFSFFRRRSSTSTELSDAPFVAGKPVLRSTRPSQPIEPSGSVELSPPLSPQLQLAVGHHAAPVATRVTEQALIELFEQLRPYQTPNPNFARMLIDRYRSIGPYDIENKHLGAGSFSIVRLGMHRLRQEKVALKFFAKDHSQGEQMVQQELAILQGLHHPSIVTVYSILETEHHFCMALQYVPNGSLLEFLNKHWSVEFGCTESAVLFKQIVLGVEYLHANGIVHRDLKPDNILLGANMRPVLVDFGLSKVVRAPSQADPAARHESVRENCGTPIYAAPELMIGTTRNFPAIDVWALGVILFNLLTCEMPYDYEPSVMTMQQLYRNIQSQAFGAPLYVPKEAERLLRRTIVVDPERRMGVSDILQHPWLVDTVITGEESMVVSPSAAEKAADQAVTELMATLDRHDQQQWRLLRSDDVTAFAQRSKEPTTVVRVKCKTMIEASAERVVDLVSDFQRRREYDNFTTSIREVEKVGHHCSVWYFMDESALYFNKVTRDFCCVTKRVQKDGKYVVASTSATHSSCPPISGRVRGEVLPSGWVVEPIGDGRCWLTYLLALDLCGNVSSSLIKRIHQGVPMFLDKIRELAMSVER